MVPALREKFNREFTPKKYHDYLEELNSLHPGDIEFRVAETPIFVDRAFKEKILSACESIVDVITQPDFLWITSRAVPEDLNVPNETDRPEFIAFDF